MTETMIFNFILSKFQKLLLKLRPDRGISPFEGLETAQVRGIIPVFHLQCCNLPDIKKTVCFVQK